MSSASRRRCCGMAEGAAKGRVSAGRACRESSCTSAPQKSQDWTCSATRAPRPARFPLFFQRLGHAVKRCCSSRGIAATISECSGRPPPTPFTVAASIPLRGRTGGLPCKVNHSKPKSRPKRDVPPDTFVSPPAQRVSNGPKSRDAPAHVPAPRLHPPQRTHLENSGLAPNRPEPVTWLPHLPTKIT